MPSRRGASSDARRSAGASGRQSAARSQRVAWFWPSLGVASIYIAACTGNIDGSLDPGELTSGGNAGSSTTPRNFDASESVARRLSQAELDNTVRDVFGDTARPARKFLPEDEYSPYDNDYTLQQASRALIDSLEALAEDVAARTLADPAKRALVVRCTPTGPGDSACFRQVIETVGRRLFRRQLREDEITQYLTLQAFALETSPHITNDFYTAVGLFIRSVLQDPEFLYRIEIGSPTDTPGVFALDSNELATRMSFLLWGTTPDEDLLGEADAGTLVDPAARLAAAERMLADERAREQLHRFHAMWLGYRAIPHGAELVGAFNEETTRLIDRVVFDQPTSYLELFQSQETYLTDLLADHYGLPRPAGGAGWVAYGNSGRAGILSHGSVLAAFSKFSDTSPTQRGIFVQTRLMCQKISSPPANVDVDQPPGDDTQVCKYDRYNEHRAVASCALCHDKMDPIGFGLENYDIGGRFRDHDDGLPQCTITGQGELPGYGTFSGPQELAQKLVDAKLIEACFVRQFYSYAVGRELTAVETTAVEGLREEFVNNGYALDKLLASHVASSTFALRREPSKP